jgi:transcriptional regulator with PAS, ATPase and Fis domain
VQADGGTLFLDEIGDMPLALQAHLLRVLQDRQVTPLGRPSRVAVDVAILCATHRNLREMIEQKLFREDLYYRLNGLAVRLPPLRERSDLMALVRRILERECAWPRPAAGPDVVRLFEQLPLAGQRAPAVQRAAHGGGDGRRRAGHHPRAPVGRLPRGCPAARSDTR